MTDQNGPEGQWEEITIQGKIFQVPVRYTPGEPLGEPEALVLNSALHEAIRNNCAKRVIDGVAGGASDAVLQKMVDDFAAAYQFGRRSPRGTRTSADPIAAAALNAAREVVRTAIKERGMDEDEWPTARVTLFAKALLDQQGPEGEIVRTARAVIEAERKTAKASSVAVHALINDSATNSPQPTAPAVAAQ